MPASKFSEQIAKTSFSQYFKAQDLEELNKLFALADDVFLERASKMVLDAEENYQQKVRAFSDNQAKQSAQELQGVLRDVQGELLQEGKAREQQLKNDEKVLLSKLENQIKNI